MAASGGGMITAARANADDPSASDGHRSDLADGGTLVPVLTCLQSWFEYAGRGMAVGSATTAERNIITVLAVDMVGSTRHIAACDPDEAQAFLDQWLDHIRSSVERVGGQIVHYAGDGGIAIFGWPTAYEDHADRACIAAWDIQSHSAVDRTRGRSGQFSRRGSFRPGRFAQRRSQCDLLALTLPARPCTLPPSCSKKRLRARSGLAPKPPNCADRHLTSRLHETSSGIADRRHRGLQAECPAKRCRSQRRRSPLSKSDCRIGSTNLRRFANDSRARAAKAAPWPCWANQVLARAVLRQPR